MAKVGWTASVGLAVGATAVIAAAQFGLAYGLGIISWTPTPRGATPDDVWLASLAWTAFVAAASTVAGALWADRHISPQRSAAAGGQKSNASALPGATGSDGRSVQPNPVATAMWRGLVAVSAAVGALLSVLLVLAPAKAAIRADTTSPELIAAAYAVVGVVIGVLIAICALSIRAIAFNVVCSAIWVWLLAIAASINGVGIHDGARVAPLAIWPFGPGTYFKTTWSVAGTALMFGAAIVIGALTARVALRRKENAVGAALAGAIGPLMVAAAYLLTAPRLVGVRASAQISAYLTAPYAVLAGLAGSVGVIALVARREGGKAKRAAEEATAANWAATITGAPLPRTPSDPTPTGTARSGAAASEGDTLQISVGNDVPGRLPAPGDTTKAEPGAPRAKPVQRGAIATATATGADKTGDGPTSDRRPSPKPTRKTGRKTGSR
jgi:hypothetical protein